MTTPPVISSATQTGQRVGWVDVPTIKALASHVFSSGAALVSTALIGKLLAWSIGADTVAGVLIESVDETLLVLIFLVLGYKLLSTLAGKNAASGALFAF